MWQNHVYIPPQTEILTCLTFVSPAELCVQHTICLPEGLVLEKERRGVFRCRLFQGLTQLQESHFGQSRAPFRSSSFNGYLIKGIKFWLFASMWDKLKARLVLEFPAESPKLLLDMQCFLTFLPSWSLFLHLPFPGVGTKALLPDLHETLHLRLYWLWNSTCNWYQERSKEAGDT